MYPQCLAFLELLQGEGFRRELSYPGVVDLIEKQQTLAWRQDVFHDSTADLDQEATASAVKIEPAAV